MPESVRGSVHCQVSAATGQHQRQKHERNSANEPMAHKVMLNPNSTTDKRRLSRFYSQVAGRRNLPGCVSRFAAYFPVMSLSVEQIAEEALALPSEARVLLADRLVESLDSVEDEKIHRLWAAEALRRRDEVRSGRVKTIPGDEALKRVRKAVAR
jgi:putative addiction module component (TIGR02574 family)